MLKKRYKSGLKVATWACKVSYFCKNTPSKIYVKPTTFAQVIKVSDTLNVQKREQTGSLRMKRLRQTGQIPAVLYGHGQENIMLSVSEKELAKAINHGSHIVDLKGAANESALIKNVQWDAFGIHVLHLDLTRVSATEAVEVTLPIELKGDAIGTHHGGEVNFLKHEVKILCPANAMPDKIVLNVSELDVEQSLNMGDLELPKGAELAEDATTPIVNCTPKASSDDENEEESEG